ncbi:MFS-type transporter SLC18B1-like isoform X1 [Amblyomma americanum]
MGTSVPAQANADTSSSGIQGDHHRGVPSSPSEDPSGEGGLGADGKSALGGAEKRVRNPSLLDRLRQYIWLVPLIHTHFWVSAAFSLMQPYYPRLATKAGLEAWQYGFVFSTFKLTMLLGSISTERLMVLSTPLKCYLCGQIGFFLYNVMFGALYWSPGGTVFLALSLVAVIFGGFVQTVYLVSAYSVVTSELHQSSGVIIAIMEFMFGCGNMAGSVLGGALIDLWQYPLPFFVLGTIITLSIPWIIMHKKVPNKHPEVPAPTEEALMQAPGSQKKLYRLLWDPLFMVNMVTLMLSWVIMGFNEPTLEPYLRQFKLSSTRLGVLYMVQFASYTVGAAFAGVFCYVKMAAFFAFAGQLMTVFAYLILGPAPFVQQDPQLWMVYVSQTFTGVGMAAQFICSFSLALSHAAKRGYPDDIRTTGFVSTVVVTFLVIGAITTPPIAGYLVLKFSYRPGSMFLFGILLFWTPITLLHWIYLMYIQRTRSADVALQERSISSRKS